MIIALLTITVLFGTLLVVKSISNAEFCVICASVSGTWLVLLGLLYAGYYGNQLVIAILLGQSIVGAMYRLKGTLPDRLSVFTLPYVLTATAAGYLLLAAEELQYLLALLISVWLGTVLLYTYRTNEWVESAFDEMIACCRDW